MTLVLLMAALLLAGVWRYHTRARLTPLEQSIVGSWRATYGPPRNAAFILDFRPDRTCLQRRADGSAMGHGVHSLGGTWHVKDGVLVCDWRRGWEAVLGVRVVGDGPTLRRLQLPTLRRVSAQEMGAIVAVTSEELTLRWPDGTLDIQKRHQEPGAR
jgi:hypothetical protein